MSKQSRSTRFEELLQVNIDALYRTALRLSQDRSLAEDLVQDASLRAYRTYANGTVPENFRAWIFRIMINLHIDRCRRASFPTETQALDEVPTADQGPAQSFANARLGRDIVAAVDRLPQDLRLVVQLVLIEGMSYREASISMGCPEGTVRSRLNRARTHLREQLADHAPESTSRRVVRFPQRKEVS